MLTFKVFKFMSSSLNRQFNQDSEYSDDKTIAVWLSTTHLRNLYISLY